MSRAVILDFNGERLQGRRSRRRTSSRTTTEVESAFLVTMRKLEKVLPDHADSLAALATDIMQDERIKQA